MRSTLCIFELATGAVEEVLSTDRLIEAPNWMPDGTALLVNGDGRMFRVPLDAPALVPIDTGHAVACNNDHGISPDGNTLVISDSTDTGESCIWLLPAAGGTPRRVTAEVPSWWHGWSVLYLAYEPGTEGHPRDRDVELRLLDPADGSVRTLLALFGGQGTINVPCWSPDGSRFAFVRYARIEG